MPNEIAPITDLSITTGLTKGFCIYDKTDEEIADALTEAWRESIVFLAADSIERMNEFWYKEDGKEKSTLISESWDHLSSAVDSVLSGFPRTPRRGPLLNMIKRGRERYVSGERFRERGGS